ncbi:MAG TPA: protein-methionine-sulfoxide reductase heme-binding subunit MsrQ [Aquabacterium sp.]|uniref:sulfite oxidase heme-binding subunit YedZ n=1 Tax=Aquabacterium sp. TaxID=1872578 RepID=UPI002E3101CD|nr:protein-methionine-sulfoxide reductase heme-binding subunit MsrQ [Aquabacterium sp.]HEX5357529.1 protein-methionine-sulfoxide reductase heme-binding subunit MsrQ [Aquabacterium sp.]
MQAMSVKQGLNQLLLRPWVKPLLWLLCALPFVVLVIKGFTGHLGANPAEKLIKETGEWALRWLWLTLAISPLREAASLPTLMRYRRALGVTTFVYALIHFLAYAWLDKGLVIDDIIKDVIKRNFILVGVVALALMTPLALTSFNSAIRKLGGRRWQALHKLVYAVALLGLLHFYWKKSAKNDVSEVMVYAVILAVLLGWRAMRKGGVMGMLKVR